MIYAWIQVGRYGDNMLDGSRCGDNLADGWIACAPEITYPHRVACLRRANYPKTTSSVLSQYFSLSLAS